MSFVTRRKPVEAEARPEGGNRLKATLSWPHLIALGVGAIIGTGIYTLTGVAAGLAGPAVIISFAVAGAVCAVAALSYAEMASLMPHAGSAYSYTYATLGELIAWVIGWSLILEYTLVCSAVSSASAGPATNNRASAISRLRMEVPFCGAAKLAHGAAGAKLLARSCDAGHGGAGFSSGTGSVGGCP